MDVEEYVRLIESCITYEQLVNLKDRVESYRFVPEKDYNRLMQLIDTQSDKIAKDD